jgi:hypothetical protein
MHYCLTIYPNSLDSTQALVRADRATDVEYADPMNLVIPPSNRPQIAKI